MIKIKSLNALLAIEKIGVPPEILGFLNNGPVFVSLSAKAFKFSNGAGEETSVPVTVDTLLALNQGLLSGETKDLLSMQICAAIVPFMKAPVDKKIVTVSMPPFAPPIAAAAKTSTAPPIAPNQTPAPASAPAGYPALTLMQAKTALTVKLSQAAKMYQPVLGTSNGSRYYMIGANADLRIAVRFSQDAMSLRVEGPGFHKHTNALAQLGLQVNVAKAYASVHLQVPGVDLRNKTLGALLYGSGIVLDTPMVNTKLLEALPHA